VFPWAWQADKATRKANSGAMEMNLITAYGLHGGGEEGKGAVHREGRIPYIRELRMLSLWRARWAWYPLLLGVWLLAGFGLGMRGDQLISLGVFGAAIVGSLLYWERRLLFVFIGVGVLLAADLLTIEGFIESAGLDVIVFLIGMMLLVGFLEERRFFDRIIALLEDWVGPRPRLLLAILMGAAFLAAALVGEVASIIFMLAALFRITDRLEVRPWPFIMALVFATNIGSAATVVGNPVGVMIALRSGLGFIDFLAWASPLALVALALVVGLMIWLLRQPLAEMRQAMRRVPAAASDPPDLWAPEMRVPWAVLVTTMGLLVVHSPLEHLLGLEKNTLLIAIALVAGGVCVLLAGPQARELVERRVEWWTLTFFLLLFASVGTLEATGAVDVVTERIREWSREDPTALLFLVSIAAGAISSVMDNVLAVATFIPVVKDLESVGVDPRPLWWGLLLGATILGNLTVIGSTANVVAVGLWEKRGGRVHIWEWLKVGFWASLPPWALAMALLDLRVRVA
jgi:Na+/H+ antiporter NhaD/arsenite permease-like protein